MGNVFDFCAGAHFDAELFELPLRAGGKFRRQMSEDSRTGFNQDDPRLGGINPPKIAFQDVPGQFRKRAGELNAGRAAAHDDDGHQPVVFGHIGCVFRFFERQQDVPPDAQRVVQGFQTGGTLLPFGVPEVAGHAAERQHEVVIAQRVLLESNFFLREVEIHHVVEQHRDSGPVGENGADRLRDLRRGQPGGGHLIEQRLEQMVILPVNERDARVRMIEGLAEGQPTEARPENHDVFVFHAGLVL